MQWVARARPDSEGGGGWHARAGPTRVQVVRRRTGGVWIGAGMSELDSEVTVLAGGIGGRGPPAGTGELESESWGLLAA